MSIVVGKNGDVGTVSQDVSGALAVICNQKGAPEFKQGHRSRTGKRTLWRREETTLAKKKKKKKKNIKKKKKKFNVARSHVAFVEEGGLVTLTVTITWCH